jgi:hypothetical protein
MSSNHTQIEHLFSSAIQKYLAVTIERITSIGVKAPIVEADRISQKFKSGI